MLHLECHVEDLVSWSVRSEPPNVTEQRMPPLTDDTVYVCETCARRNISVGDEVKPADLQYTPLAAQMEGLKLLSVSFQDCPRLGPVQQQRQNTAVVNEQLRRQAELAITPDTVQLAHVRRGESNTVNNIT